MLKAKFIAYLKGYKHRGRHNIQESGARLVGRMKQESSTTPERISIRKENEQSAQKGHGRT